MQFTRKAPTVSDATQRTMGQTVPRLTSSKRLRFRKFKILKTATTYSLSPSWLRLSWPASPPLKRACKGSQRTAREVRVCSRCQKTRVELVRSRLESPARRRNSSAESPGPSNVMSVVQRALQPALQPPMHPPLQSQLHSQLEMQS